MAGTEETALASFAILNQLMRVLASKGVLTDGEVFDLVEAAAGNLNRDTSHAAKGAARYIGDYVLAGLKK